LIGRDAKLGTLKEALAAVLRGRGQLALIIGEADVGKSRLVAEPKEAALSPRDEAHGTPQALWLEGRCLELTTGASYWRLLLQRGARPDHPRRQRAQYRAPELQRTSPDPVRLGRLRRRGGLPRGLEQPTGHR
jgi:hypothetical protein